MFGKLLIKLLRSRGFDVVPMASETAGERLTIKPLDPKNVEVLSDAEFQRSCREIYEITVLDTPRLANLWNLSRLTDPAGNMLEVGTYRGGSALHLSNANPKRKLFVCDSFEGFRQLDPVLDSVFNMKMFKDTSKESVEELFTSRGRPVQVIKGYFPASCQNVPLQPLSFAYLDVDTYEGTNQSLDYLATRMMPRSLIVLDDYQRKCQGVDRAATEFLAKHPSWTSLPLFPSQGVLIPQTWFQG